jgi:putative membrane-bound dehydrogenase-like protein
VRKSTHTGSTSLKQTPLVAVLATMILTAIATAQTDFDGPLAHITVPDGFAIEMIAGPPLVKYPYQVGLDNRGRLFVCESAGLNMKADELLEHLPNSIKMLTDDDGDGRYDSATTFADRMTFPQGLLSHQDWLYTASPPSIWRLKDVDDDGVADQREEFVTKFGFLGHAGDIHGPFLGPTGRLFWPDAPLGHEIRDKAGKILSKGRAARVFSIRDDGSDLETYAGGGMFNPVEVEWTPEGDLIGIMTWYNPDEARHDALVHYIYGGVYPKRVEAWIAEFKRTGPLMPAMIRYGVVAPSAITRYRGSGFGELFADNYFISYFNTGRIDRIRLTVDGSTYKADATTFLQSTHHDFHPCDIVEDADGSLIVVDTGGWFLNGCPTSQIGKPEITGAIYRIRRTGAARVEDPYGKRLVWNGLSDGALLERLRDSRNVVRQRAIGELGARESAVESLAGMLAAPTDIRVKQDALWSLARIDSQAARQAIRFAVADVSPRVRQVAIHCLAVNRDPEAVELLKTLVVEEEAAIRRESATALGRIGDPSAVEALLQAASNPIDRSLEHAIRFALIEIDDRASTVRGLASDSPLVRETALIALDQMDNGQLSREQTLPLLDTTSRCLQQTVLEIMGRRRWTEGTHALVSQWLRRDSLTPSERQTVRGVLLSQGGDSQTQQVVAAAAVDDGLPLGSRQLVWEVMARSEVEDVPAAWRAAIKKQFQEEPSELVGLAMDVIERRKMAELTPLLVELATNQGRPEPMRLRASCVLGALGAELAQDVFGQLIAAVRDGAAADALAAAHALSSANLTRQQVLELASALVEAGPLSMRTLLRAFEGQRFAPDAVIGSELVRAVSLSAGRLSLSVQEWQALVARYPASVQSAAQAITDQLKAETQDQAARLATLGSQLSRGDPEQGREVFFGNRASCSACHRIAGRGEALGPDLSQIGEVRTRRDLLEAIVFPSASFARGYESFLVITSAGKAFSGIISEQTSSAITLRTADRAELVIRREDIDELIPATVSVMPQGLDGILTTAELSDLIAYLESLQRGP